MTLDKAEIAKLKVAELKAELESRSIEVPKGAKKADLVALLETQVEGGASSTVGDAPPAAEPEDSNDVADEIEKISAEDDLAADLAADDDDKVKTENQDEASMGQLDVHAGEDDLSKDVKTEDVELKMPKESGDVRGSSPELEPPPVKKRRESPTHESRSSSHRHAEPRDDRRHRDRRDRNRAPDRMDSDPKWDDSRVQISPYMCDMNMKITDNNRAENINYEGLGYCYGGAKATHGVRGGKVCFEMHLSRELPTRHLHADEKSVYWCRVGWSTGMSDLTLGEDIGSIGFDSHAKLAHNKNFIEFGSTYKRGDTIGCFLDLTNPESVTLAYTRNGKQQLGDDGEETITISRAELGVEENSAFYPHFMVKNYAVHLHFGRRSSDNSDLWESAPKALRDFKLVGSVPSEERIAGPVEPQEKRDCTVIMMCGLPCSGKTTWADQHMAENRAKHFHTIGNECIMDRMSICGEKREKYNNKHGTPYDVLQSTTMGAVLRIMERCHRKKRNYILDQANIYINGHSKKMGPFEGFHRRAVVCVPSEEEYEKRKEKKVKEGGRKITHDSSMKWKAAMTLPEKDSGLFEQIDYLDLPQEEAEVLVAEYNKVGEEYKKKMEEKYGTSDRGARGSRRTDSRDQPYSNPPPVVYSSGGGAPGSGASNDANSQAWQEYYKKYYEYYGQYPQGQGMPPPVVSNSSQYSSGSGSDTAQQWAQYQQQYQQYYQQYQQYYQQQMQK